MVLSPVLLAEPGEPCSWCVLAARGPVVRLAPADTFTQRQLRDSYSSAFGCCSEEQHGMNAHGQTSVQKSVHKACTVPRDSDPSVNSSLPPASTTCRGSGDASLPTCNSRVIRPLPYIVDDAIPMCCRRQFAALCACGFDFRLVQNACSCAPSLHSRREPPHTPTFGASVRWSPPACSGLVPTDAPSPSRPTWTARPSILAAGLPSSNLPRNQCTEAWAPYARMQRVQYALAMKAKQAQHIRSCSVARCLDERGRRGPCTRHWTADTRCSLTVPNAQATKQQRHAAAQHATSHC